MKEVFEKIIERLKKRSEEYNSGVRLHGKPEEMLTHEAIEIVNQVASEFNLDQDSPKTNADRIRSMPDEELAKFIRAVRCCTLYGDDCGYPFCHSMKGNLCNGIKESNDEKLLDWLQSEVEE